MTSYHMTTAKTSQSQFCNSSTNAVYLILKNNLFYIQCALHAHDTYTRKSSFIHFFGKQFH